MEGWGFPSQVLRYPSSDPKRNAGGLRGGLTGRGGRSREVRPRALFRRRGRRLVPVRDDGFEQVELALDTRHAIAQILESLVHLFGQLSVLLVHLFGQLPVLLVHPVGQLPVLLVHPVDQLPVLLRHLAVLLVHMHGKAVDPAVEPTALLKNQPCNANADTENGGADAKNGDEFRRELFHEFHLSEFGKIIIYEAFALRHFCRLLSARCPQPAPAARGQPSQTPMAGACPARFSAPRASRREDRAERPSASCFRIPGEGIAAKNSPNREPVPAAGSPGKRNVLKLDPKFGRRPRHSCKPCNPDEETSMPESAGKNAGRLANAEGQVASGPGKGGDGRANWTSEKWRTQFCTLCRPDGGRAVFLTSFVAASGATKGFASCFGACA